jgi:hypothetical protein
MMQAGLDGCEPAHFIHCHSGFGMPSARPHPCNTATRIQYDGHRGYYDHLLLPLLLLQFVSTSHILQLEMPVQRKEGSFYTSLQPGTGHLDYRRAGGGLTRALPMYVALCRPCRICMLET